MDYIKFTPYNSHEFSRTMSYIHKEKPYLFNRVVTSFSQSQVESKLWLNEELGKIKNEFNNVTIIGGWYCHILANILIENYNTKFICNYEIDQESKKISYKFNKTYKDIGKYYCSTNNLFVDNLLSYQTRQGDIDLLINPSCEHMYYMKDILTKHFKYSRPLCVFQSTDNDEYDDHINCVKDPEELADQAGMVDIKYIGTKKLSNGMNRFMVIGR